MNKKEIKDWTILIYATGNNELAPEMWQCKIDAEKVGSSDNVNVVMEIGRESRDLVKIIRPLDLIPEDNENWTGVRRYYLLNSKSILTKDLGKINMADPRSLYDFIEWGTKTYPAKHYMLVLSGHGGGFAAVMSDLSQDAPYMMGVYEMCKTINLVRANLNIQIDILVLDICDMNLVEIMYELGKNKDTAVKSVLTYISKGRISGLPYDKLIHYITQNSGESDYTHILTNLIDYINLNLVAVKIDHQKLKKIKNLTNSIAYLYLSDNKCKKTGGLELLNLPDINSSRYEHVLELHNTIRAIIIYHKNSFLDENTILNILNLTTRELCNDAIDSFLPIYYKLSFAKNNYWFYVLSEKPLQTKLTVNTLTNGLSPSILSPNGLVCVIQSVNPTVSKEQIKAILYNLYTYKNWIYNSNENKIYTQPKVKK